MTQPGIRIVASGHQFARVFVFQIFQPELAVLGNRHAFGQQFRRIDRGQRLARAQMPFAVGKQAVASLCHGGLVTDRSHRVLQRAARAHVHVHIATGHQRQLQTFAERLQPGELGCIVGTAMQFDGEPAAVGEARGEPCAVRIVARCISFLEREP